MAKLFAFTLLFALVGLSLISQPASIVYASVKMAIALAFAGALFVVVKDILQDTFDEVLG